jgi:small subunit ribosomal protein S1
VADNPKGSIVKGVVKEVDIKHAVIDLGEGVEGVLRASEISRERVEDVRHLYKEGDELEAKFTGTDRKSRMLSLSIKAKDYDDEAEAMSDYNQSSEDATSTTLGDLLKEQLGDRDNS